MSASWAALAVAAVIAGAVLAVALLLGTCGSSSAVDREPLTIVAANGTTAHLNVEIADTPEEATELRTRADLMRGITARVKSWDVPLGEAAKRLGLTPPRLNDLLRGKFNRFSLDDLMTAATAAGIAPPAPRKSSWDDLRGIVKGNGARFTIEEINDAIAEAGAAAGMAGMNDHDGD